ncbi:hypothetical protein PVL29_005170 [Vitis rotundifolia]|uniref:Uncharacterized protein n=1 Tax=Vitis rotundifolia TaxID=103349 RepID=A0AA39AB37_VITRO|nr:hypothetical protein PVL29_005170 [Vitis rotundifolia]
MKKESMGMQQVICMKGGVGEGSQHSASLLGLCCTTLPESVAIADLGCSSGPNTFCAVSEIMTIIYKRCCQLVRSPPRFWVFSNDLPGNDFNSMRGKNGEEFGLCHVAAVPASFYHKLVPPRTLQFVHSACSLHWLSHVPPELLNKQISNKGKICLPKSSSTPLIDAYAAQFQRDFSLFLRLRAEEIVPGGRMVLPFKARRTPDPVPDESCLLQDQLAQALQELVSEWLIAEEKLDSYNVPYYEPYTEDIVTEIEKEGSFGINGLEIMALPWDSPNGGQNYDRSTSAQKLAKSMRAVHEPMLASHFGAEIIAADTREVEHVAVLVSMTRKT